MNRFSKQSTRMTLSLMMGFSLGLSLLGCSPTKNTASKPVPTLIFTDCRLPRLENTARCAQFAVPENWQQPSGKEISLLVVQLPAYTARPAPDPLFVLAGGPGQAASRLGPMVSLFEPVRRERDVFLIDQRGTGGSSPLNCPELAVSADMETLHLGWDNIVGQEQRVRTCIQQLKADLTQYTTERFIQDLEAVRKALGRPQVNLWGASYGTRAALHYAQRYPKQVRSMILDGVVPPEYRLGLDNLLAMEGAISLFWERCAAEADCNKVFPEISARWRALDARLVEKLPLTHPSTGRAATFSMRPGDWSMGISGLLYTAESTAIVPYLVEQAYQGNFAPVLAWQTKMNKQWAEQMSFALHFSVVCNEDLPLLNATQRQRASELKHLGSYARVLQQICQIWPHRANAENASTQPDQEIVLPDIPTLLFSGGVDPVTPPEGAASVARRLPRSKHIMAPGFGHNVTGYPCVPALMAQFIQAAQVDGLSNGCLEALAKTQPSPFYMDALGPLRPTQQRAISNNKS